jgi:uncharacterized protein with LGFP repeats
MLRRSNILTAAALALCCALAPAAAAEPFTDAERKLVEEYQDQQSTGAPGPFTDAERKLVAEYQAQQSTGAPGPFTDAERKLVAEYQAQQSTGAPGPFTDAERKLVESAEVQAMVDRVSAEIRATPAIVEVEAPSGGFDWGDAGIGAAGMLALFSIAGGSALLLASRRRREGVRVATH